MKKSLFTLLAICFSLAPAVLLSNETNDAHEILRQRFEEKAKETIDSLDAVFGLTILDLKTGETFGVNQDLEFTQASVIKVPILVELYRQAEAGDIALDETILVEKDAVVGGSGILLHLTPGKVSMTVRDLAVLMIVVSDNTATNALIDLVGMENVNSTMKDLGFPATRLQRKMMDRQARLENRENISTPREAAALMEVIYRREILSEDSCADILDILSIAKTGRIATNLPSGVRVANKTGSVGGVVNDLGIVFLENRPFIVSAMASWNMDREAAEAAIAEITRLAYDYLDRIENSNRFGHRK